MTEAKQSFYVPTGQERPAVLARIIRTVEALPLDKQWTVVISQHKPRRTDAQNRYLWGVCYPAILQGGGETLGGWRAEDLHEYFLGETFGWELMEGFGQKRKRPIRRSSTMNKQEFSDYVNTIQQRAAELGIVIPDASEHVSDE